MFNFEVGAVCIPILDVLHMSQGLFKGQVERSKVQSQKNGSHFG